MRLRRLRRWWPVGLVIFLALLVYAAWPGGWTFTVGPETTYVTGPLDAEGYIDYPAALNERLRDGVTPETNANVLIWRALGPHPEGGTMPPEYFRWLGIESPPEEGEYYVSSDKYFETQLKGLPDDEPERWFEWWADEEEELPVRRDRRQEWHDRVDRVRKGPWKARDHSDISDWLKLNEKSLALMVEASQRPVYFNPLVSTNSNPRSARLIGSLLPSVQKCRDVGRALTCRAMGKLADGNPDGAWQDLLACHRLGRLIASRGTLIESLVGIALDAIATNGELALLSHGKPSSAQALAWLADLRALPPLPSFAQKLDVVERFVTLDSLLSIACSGPQGLAALNGLPGGPGQPVSPLGERLFTRSIDFDRAFRLVNRTFEQCVVAARLPDRSLRQAEYVRINAELDEAVKASRQNGLFGHVAAGRGERGEQIGNILMGLLMPALQKIQDSLDRTEQTQRNQHVAFALAAYRADTGRYPARLDELAPKYLPAIPGDLFSGKPLIYRPEKDGYLFYSVGVNGLDEDGRWIDDDPRGDDPRVRMPVPEPKEKPKTKREPVPGRKLDID